MGLGTLPEANLEGDEGAIFAEINITPLTDIFLLLMIIFIVSGSAQVQKLREEQIAEKSAGLKIDLPSGQAREIDVGRKSMVVSIRTDGPITVNGHDVTERGLDAAFQSAFADFQDTQVIIRADIGVTHGKVVGVMERAKRVGLRKLAIATKGQ